MQWFRLYNEFAHDIKVQKMSEANQRRLIMIFCLYSEGQLIDVSDDDIAFVLRISEEEAKQTKDIFLKNGFIDENWIPVNWHKRQFQSDNSTERVKKYRDKDEELKTNKTCNGNETFQKNNVKQSVTPPDTDTDTDTEQIKAYNNAPAREDVEKIYSLYPKKTAPKKAKQSIEAALKKIDADSLAQAVTEYAESPYVRSCIETGNKQYIPHPATWFNQERWDDDRDTWKIPCSEASKAGWKQDQLSQQKTNDPIREEIEKRVSFIDENEADKEVNRGMIKAREKNNPLHGRDLGFHNGSWAWGFYCRFCWEELGIDATKPFSNGRSPPQERQE